MSSTFRPRRKNSHRFLKSFLCNCWPITSQSGGDAMWISRGIWPSPLPWSSALSRVRSISLRVHSQSSISTKANDHAGGDTKIVLMIIHSVIETRQIIVGFKGSQSNMPGEADIESATRDHRKRVSRSRQPRAAGSQASTCMGSAEECLSERPEVAAHRPAVSRTCQKRRERQVSAAARDVGRILTGDFTDDAQRAAEVKCHPGAAAVQREAPATSRRQVRPHIVVVETYIQRVPRVGTLRQRGRGCRRAESESQQKKSQCLFPYEY